jgi:hypothetical protein
MMILIGLLLILPLLGDHLGLDLGLVSRGLSAATNAVLDAILRLTGIL